MFNRSLSLALAFAAVSSGLCLSVDASAQTLTSPLKTAITPTGGTFSFSPGITPTKTIEQDSKVAAKSAPSLLATSAIKNYCKDKSWSYSKSDSDSYGGSKFGASYDWSVDFKATAGTSADYARAQADFNIDAKMFSVEKSIVHFEGDAWSSETLLSGKTSKTGLYLDFQVLGSSVSGFPKSYTATYSNTWSIYNGTIFSASYSFGIPIGPIVLPVTVSGKLKGDVDLTASASLSLYNVEATLTPSARAWVTASVGIGGSTCSAGVYTDLDIIDVDLPVSADLNWSDALCGKITYSIEGDMHLETLNGAVGVYAECFGLGVDYEITDWTGYTYDWDLFTVSGSI